MKRKATLFTLLFIGCSTAGIFAQAGYSSSSVSMNRSNDVVSSDQVIIEEYLNYHRHLISAPKNGNEISMELRWGNNQINQDNTAIIQIGLATNQIMNYASMPPINMCVVVDKSGSMSSDNRLEKVKLALLKFVEGLRPKDMISIVIYDSEASVALAPTLAGDLNVFKTVIEGLQPGSSTNLNAGMVLGYEQVLKNYDEKSTNRVILLTDGIANQGVVDPEAIVSNSNSYHKKGIDISTIGVGSNVNYTLLQQIAREGKGQNHFVGDDGEDIKKAFVDELESLLSPIAKNVVLEVKFPKGVKVESILGYSPEFEGNKVRFRLDNMNSGLTQIVLIKFKLEDKSMLSQQLPFEATLNYYSYSNKKENSLVEKEELLTSLPNENSEYFNDAEVKKNYWIGYMAYQLKEVAKLTEKDKLDDAVSLINLTLKQTNDQFPQLKDNDIVRVKDILQKNADLLNSFKNVEVMNLQIR